MVKTARPSKKQPSLLVLYIELQDIEPVIWRRVAVPENITLARLHLVVQAVMGWENCHLNEFCIAGENYGPPDPDGLLPIKNQTRKTLIKALNGTKAFDYLYDYGDSWNHCITVEATLPFVPRQRIPYCIDGANACPPEDVGGPYGYANFRAIMQDPDHPEHQDAMAWWGAYPFLPDLFYPRAAQTELNALKL